MSPNPGSLEAEIMRLRGDGVTPSRIVRKLQSRFPDVTRDFVKEVLQGPEDQPREWTFEEMTEEVIRRQKYQESNSLRYRKEVVRFFDEPLPIAVSFFSDVHLGSGGVWYQQLVKDTDTVHNTPGLYCIHNGDEMNNFIIGRLQAASRHDAFQPDDQWRFLRAWFRRLAPKTLAAVRGNHTDWTQMLADVDVRGEICAHLNILDIGHGGRVSLTVGEHDYTIYMRHKFRFESALNPFNAVVRMYEMVAPFDIGVIGHTHVAGISTQSRQDRFFTAIRPGSYKVHDAYADEWGFTGSACISPTVILLPDRKEAIPFANVSAAADYLTYLREVVYAPRILRP